MADSEIFTILRDQTDRLLAEHVTREALAAADGGAWPEALWATLEEAGMPLAMVPEAAGGAGLAPAEALLLLRRAGYHALPLPLGETMLANALWVAAGGDAIAGPATLAPAGVEDVIEMTMAGGKTTVHGHLAGVPWGERAMLLVLARAADGADHLVLLAPPSLAAKPRRNLAGEPRPTLHLDGAIAIETRTAPALAQAGLRALGAALRAQQMVGAMEHALDHALTYANERQQFGRPIGKFQAVQHMLAEAAGHFAAATAAADGVIATFGGGDMLLAAAIAKARVGEAAGKVAEIAHQVHGAMGFTQEHTLHFLTRRLWSWRDEFGNEAEWQRLIGRRVLAAGGAALWPMLAGA